MPARRPYQDQEVMHEVVQIPITIRHTPRNTGVYGPNEYHIDVDNRTCARYNASTNMLALEGDVFPQVGGPEGANLPIVRDLIRLIQKQFGRKPTVSTGEPYWKET